MKMVENYGKRMNYENIEQRGNQFKKLFDSNRRELIKQINNSENPLDYTLKLVEEGKSSLVMKVLNRLNFVDRKSENNSDYKVRKLNESNAKKRVVDAIIDGGGYKDVLDNWGSIRGLVNKDRYSIALKIGGIAIKSTGDKKEEIYDYLNKNLANIKRKDTVPGIIFGYFLRQREIDLDKKLAKDLDIDYKDLNKKGDKTGDGGNHDLYEDIVFENLYKDILYDHSFDNVLYNSGFDNEVYYNNRIINKGTTDVVEHENARKGGNTWVDKGKGNGTKGGKETVKKTLDSNESSDKQKVSEQWLYNKALEYGVTDKRQIAYILSTVKGECGFKNQKEIGGERRSYGKIDSKTGKAYYGRGFIQLTHKYNYQKFTDIIRSYGKDFKDNNGNILKGNQVDLVNNPDLILQSNDLAAFIAIYGMKNGTFTGKKLDDFINDKKTDFYHARSIINGMSSKPNYYANNAQKYMNSIGSTDNYFA